MPHGTPDWSDKRKTAYVSAVLDAGELAVRLGSPIVLDRRGDLWWYESWEHGLGDWMDQGLGTGHAIDVTTETALRGSASLLMTTGSDADQSARARKYLSLPPWGRIGLAETWKNRSPFDRHELYAIYTDTDYGYPFGLSYSSSFRDLRYYDSDGNWTPFATGINLSVVDAIWVEWKVVIDLGALRYVRAIVGRQEYDLTGLQLRRVAAAMDPSFYVRLHHYGVLNANRRCVVDFLALTINEP